MAGAITWCRLVIGAAEAYGVGKLIGHAFASAAGFAECRYGRRWMPGCRITDCDDRRGFDLAVDRPVRTLSTCSLQPPHEPRLLAASTSTWHRAPRSARPKPWSTEAAALVDKDPSVERVFERVNVGNGPQHRAQEGPRVNQHRVRADRCPQPRRNPRRTGQLPEPERAAAGCGSATSRSSSAATIRNC